MNSQRLCVPENDLCEASSQGEDAAGSGRQDTEYDVDGTEDRDRAYGNGVGINPESWGIK